MASRSYLDKLMGPIEATLAWLSECLFAVGASLHIDGGKLPTAIIDGEAAFELILHMLVAAPANKVHRWLGRYARIT
ncbi:hypothetical protein [Bradyrhizobium monzae]|uniref:hypothetical protein n=1 Tax=Bradyrhizobium sp. Oc8 TaxID=2876780 RepID=UPI001F265EF7|nr:hypothetical protein [Bradyrhizobium sp. Oc8]